MRALIVVDVQNDFCEGGALEVPEANEVIPYINQLITSGVFDETIFSQDYHPADHVSFADNHDGKQVGEFITLDNGYEQILWPTHCVQETRGVAFQDDIILLETHMVVRKGQNRLVDSYSAFYDNNKEVSTGLSDYLKSKSITDVHIVGLALDYCVKFTALDSVSEGFNTTLHFKGTKAVNINPTDGDHALIEMIRAGVHVVS